MKEMEQDYFTQIDPATLKKLKKKGDFAYKALVALSYIFSAFVVISPGCFFTAVLLFIALFLTNIIAFPLWIIAGLIISTTISFLAFFFMSDYGRDTLKVFIATFFSISLIFSPPALLILFSILTAKMGGVLFVCLTVIFSILSAFELVSIGVETNFIDLFDNTYLPSFKKIINYIDKKNLKTALKAGIKNKNGEVNTLSLSWQQQQGVSLSTMKTAIKSGFAEARILRTAVNDAFNKNQNKNQKQLIFFKIPDYCDHSIWTSPEPIDKTIDEIQNTIYDSIIVPIDEKSTTKSFDKSLVAMCIKQNYPVALYICKEITFEKPIKTFIRIEEIAKFIKITEGKLKNVCALLVSFYARENGGVQHGTHKDDLQIITAYVCPPLHHQQLKYSTPELLLDNEQTNENHSRNLHYFR